MAEGNKVAVITGVGRGLGQVMAQGLALEGYLVLGCSHSEGSCSSAAAILGSPHVVRKVDVADAPAVETWAKEMLREHGPPNLLINNAAVINRNAELWKVEVEDFRRTMRVNVEGTFHVIRSFLPAMIERGKGVIVNFSSGWGRSTSPEVAPYCASKFAIEGLSRSLSQELPSGLACVALNPGVINTDMLNSCFADGAKAYPSPQKWAKVAVPFLLNLSAADNGKSLSIPNF
jgi:NAD(P)-dependent dehydrogenase (short-subunit alcohol dehydrogenase family)